MAILTRRMLYRRLLRRGRLAEIVPIKAHRKFQRTPKSSVARTLRQARTLNLTEILVIGMDSAGDIQVQASPPDPGNSMWLMASATKKLLGD